MVMRSRTHFMGIAKSDRQGHVWQAAHQSAVPCPNSGLDVARLSDGRLLLVYNPSMHFGASAFLLLLLPCRCQCVSAPYVDREPSITLNPPSPGVDAFAQAES